MGHDRSKTAQRERRHAAPLYRVYMDVMDGLVAAVSHVLRLGGAPLRRLLIRLGGDVMYALMPGRRRVALVNLDLAFGDTLTEDEKRRIVRDSCRHMVRFGLDFIWDDVHWPAERLRAAMAPPNTAAMDEAVAHGGGYVIVSGHLGNFELNLRTVTDFGYEAACIYKPFSGGWFDRFVARKRDRRGLWMIRARRKELVAAGEDGGTIRRAQSIRHEIEAHWKESRAVISAGDQYPRGGAVMTTFLGVPDTPTQAGAIRYAVEGRHPITLHAMMYRPDGTPEWLVDGPVYIEEQPGGFDATVQHYLQITSDWLTEKIRAYPDQYFWTHRRFPRHYYRESPRKQRRPPSDSRRFTQR